MVRRGLGVYCQSARSGRLWRGETMLMTSGRALGGRGWRERYLKVEYRREQDGRLRGWLR